MASLSTEKKRQSSCYLENLLFFTKKGVNNKDRIVFTTFVIHEKSYYLRVLVPKSWFVDCHWKTRTMSSLLSIASQLLAECLAHSTCSINIYWHNVLHKFKEWILFNIHIQNLGNWNSFHLSITVWGDYLAGGSFLEIRFQTEIHLSANDTVIKKWEISNKIAKSNLLPEKQLKCYYLLTPQDKSPSTPSVLHLQNLLTKQYTPTRKQTGPRAV